MSSSASQFTGTLVRRQYKRGQPFVQLVFKDGRQTRLSLSRSAQLIQFLKVGQTYRISGAEYTLGGKTFIREPEAELVPQHAARPQKRWILAGAGALLVVIAGGVFAAGHLASKKPVQAVNSSSARTDVAEVPAAATVLGAATSAPPAPSAIAPSTTPVKSVARAVSRSAAPSPAPARPQTPAPVAPQTPQAPSPQNTTPPLTDDTAVTPPPTDTSPADTTPPTDTTTPPADTPPDTTPPPADTPPTP